MNTTSWRLACLAMLPIVIAIWSYSRAGADARAGESLQPTAAERPENGEPPRGKQVALDITGNQWTFRAQGPWQDIPDRRGLRAMRYPWHVSTTGEQAELTRSITLPADFPPPYTLSFFCSDDYPQPHVAK
jgi:hypothetical protein